MPVGCFKNQKRHKNSKGHISRDITLKTGLPDNSASSDIVILTRQTDDDIIGIIFAGGIDTPNKPHIITLRPGCLASKSDALQVGDYLTAINNIHTDKLKHEEIVTLFKNTASLIQLEVEFPLPPKAPQSVYTVKCKRTTVTLVKDDDSLGLVLRGGSHPNKTKSRPLTITHVRQGGPAHRHGVLRSGDRIVAINGVNVIAATLDTARRIIRNSEDVVNFVVEYDIAIMESVQNADGPLLIEISKSCGNELGISLGQQVKLGKPTLVIESIVMASIAERCGALHVGDHLMAIDGMDLHSVSKGEAEHFLKNNASKTLQLEILPVGHLLDTREPTAPISAVDQGIGTPPSLCDHSFLSVFDDDQINTHSLKLKSVRNTLHPHKGYQSSLRSISSLASSGGQSMRYHEETMDVCLYANHVGIGLTLQSNTLPDEILEFPPFLGMIEKNGSAERCGVIQEGDRVVAVNGVDLTGYSLIECRKLLEESKNKCLLTIAFDVVDKPSAGSGTFQVKLLKRGNSFGIHLAEKTDLSGRRYVIVSELDKGSPGYRSGVIDCDDEVISIDNIHLSTCSVVDAKQILQNTDEVMKIKLKKHSLVGADSNVVFSVEIPRQGKSIGLTISGKEEPGYPIVISELTPGGMARRIGAIQVGDQLLSINGKSVKDQTVSFAIKLLHQKCDSVFLTICRPRENTPIDPEHYQKLAVDKPAEHRSGHSGDSALESWDSDVHSPQSQSDYRKVKQRRPGEQNNLSQMISDLENVGRLEISNILNEMKPLREGNNPSTSSPQDRRKPLPPPNVSDSSLDYHMLSINLVKNNHENFGFGISNAVYGDGCYVCAIGKQGPAERAGLKKHDCLIQINGNYVQSYSCNDIVPLIENAGSTLELLVKRTADSQSSTSSHSSIPSSINSK